MYSGYYLTKSILALMNQQHVYKIFTTDGAAPGLAETWPGWIILTEWNQWPAKDRSPFNSILQFCPVVRLILTFRNISSTTLVLTDLPSAGY